MRRGEQLSTDSLCELIVHHEVVNMFLSASEFQLACKYCDHESRAAGTLQRHIHTSSSSSSAAASALAVLIDFRIDSKVRCIRAHPL